MSREELIAEIMRQLEKDTNQELRELLKYIEGYNEK